MEEKVMTIYKISNMNLFKKQLSLLEFELENYSYELLMDYGETEHLLFAFNEETREIIIRKSDNYPFILDIGKKGYEYLPYFNIEKQLLYLIEKSGGNLSHIYEIYKGLEEERQARLASDKQIVENKTEIQKIKEKIISIFSKKQ